MLPYPPALVVHADWSKDKKKRWMARAVLEKDRYVAFAPEPVGDPEVLLLKIRQLTAPEGAILIGFDFPIGLPVSYAQKAGIIDFVNILPKLGGPRWPDFYNVADSPEQISLKRPFYPDKPGPKGTKKQTDLLEKLNLSSKDELLRYCEKGSNGLVTGSPLFWTIGGKQVGKAAISGWRDMFGPALRDKRLNIRFWPFHGSLSSIVGQGSITICETYPAEFYGHLGVNFLPKPGRKTGKRVQRDRVSNAPALLHWARRTGVRISPELETSILSGFGTGAKGEDLFDAVVGLLGMLNVVVGHRGEGTPDNEAIKRIEGWILGRPSLTI